MIFQKKTLIPRPETEYWVGEVITEIAAELEQHPSRNLRVLDLCCGSGCIGIALLKKFPMEKMTVDFADIDSRAIAQTQLNIEYNHIEKTRTNVLEAHLFDACSGEYDYILSNPPYVDISGEVGDETKYEPSLALFAQNNGLALIEEILLSAKKYLKKDGKLFLEFGMGQETEIKKMIENTEVFTAEFRKDQFEITRFIKLTFRHQN